MFKTHLSSRRPRTMYGRERQALLARRFSAVAVLALAWLPTVVLGLASCCVNSTSGADFADDCMCLVDNTQLPGQFLAAGETRIYHWVLSTDNSELVTGSVRGNLTFEMAPCNGSASIDIKSGSPSSWQNLPSFNSSDDHNLVSVTIPAKFTEQACMVTAGEADTAFDIAVYTTLYDRPVPGNGGMLSAEMLSAGTARVLMNTTETEAAGDVKYSLYWSSLPEVGDGTCTVASENATLRENPNCLFWSKCGMENAADGRSDWVTLEPNVGYVFEVAVETDSLYLFNVAMMDPRNITSVYAGTNVSFTATNYQDCVADPGCTSQLNDDSTIVAIAAVAVAALALLITAMKLLHSSIAKVMRDTVSSRRGQSYVGGTKALFGKNGRTAPNTTKPGKIHVESFDGIENDSTPLASPIIPYVRESSTKKVGLQEEDNSIESDAFLAQSRDKPDSGNRASPKRGSVGSPSRSRSPRRQTTRLDKDKDDSYREGAASDTNNDGHSKRRSVAASPRSRNRRGRGGGGKGGEGNGDESDADAPRVAPRSARDNSLSGSGVEPEGEGWQTSVSGRSSLTGVTRTHKSPREPRSREKSPSAAREKEETEKEKEKERGTDYEDEGADGAHPRKRKTRRQGDWESQVARSTAMLGEPRRRKPKADKNNDKGGRSSRRRGQDDEDEDEDEDQR